MTALCNHYQRRRQICDVLVPFFCSVKLVPTNFLMHNLGNFTMTTSMYAKYIFLARTDFMLCTCSFFSTDCILNNEILVRNGYSWTSASTLRSVFVIHFQLLPFWRHSQKLSIHSLFLSWLHLLLKLVWSISLSKVHCCILDISF